MVVATTRSPEIDESGITMSELFDGNDNFLIYDGECPVCKRYVEFMRLQKAVGHVQLYNARENPELVSEMAERGFDIDDGILLKLGPTLYFADECINAMAQYGDNVTWLQRLHNRLFSNAATATKLYPIMRAARNSLLRILSIKKINQ
jgi:uncharacterized protein YbaR (Trm112 family)